MTDVTVSEVFRELERVLQECSFENWDGARAKPVSEETLRNARTFLELLPQDIETPQVGVEPPCGQLIASFQQNCRTPGCLRHLLLRTQDAFGQVDAWLRGTCLRKQKNLKDVLPLSLKHLFFRTDSRIKQSGIFSRRIDLFSWKRIDMRI